MSTEARTVTSEAGEAWRQLRALATDPEVLARLREEFEALGLTLGVAKALLRLSPTEPNAMRQLAGALHCDNSYVTTVVDALEERGLARREAHPRDRRVKVVVLTAAG
ncbi:MAG TPA: MarR family transcriptional regulator, partial [Acidimicrobiales bacterium]|nr:MarR family transcriptional regulator [Acidimicrobiales bacterium]